VSDDDLERDFDADDEQQALAQHFDDMAKWYEMTAERRQAMKEAADEGRLKEYIRAEYIAGRMTEMVARASGMFAPGEEI
jgi:hypothetical protein